MSSASALSAGDDSAPDASEKMSGSKGFRGVVKEGLRKGVACGALLGEFMLKRERPAGVAVLGFEGDPKVPAVAQLF